MGETEYEVLKAFAPRRSSILLLAVATPLLLWILQPASQVDFRNLTYKVGAYNLVQAADVSKANGAGFQMVLARHGGDTPLTRALAQHGMQYVDSSIQSLLYRAYCPKGLGSCKSLTPRTQSTLVENVKQHVRRVKGTGTVAAYYILDDYYSDMAPGLQAVYRAIRSVDAKTPTMCAFYQDLAYKGRDGSHIMPTRPFARSLRNYSPQWCDAVGVYAYAPSFTGTTPPPRPTVEWDMRTSLPWVMSTLKKKGWDPSKHILVGMPGAFGYEPRTGKPTQGTFAVPQWRYAPTAAELSAQVVAFCRAGARTILPYVWNDNSPGTTYGLHNSQSLRSGVQQGVATCRQRYWN